MRCPGILAELLMQAYTSQNRALPRPHRIHAICGETADVNHSRLQGMIFLHSGSRWVAVRLPIGQFGVRGERTTQDRLTIERYTGDGSGGRQESHYRGGAAHCELKVSALLKRTQIGILLPQTVRAAMADIESDADAVTKQKYSPQLRTVSIRVELEQM
jgi:hypothetical protein